MSYFEECLTSGGLRFQEERRALYKYLLEINGDLYIDQANLLLENGMATRNIANGEATFILKDRKVNYSARKLGSNESQSDLRELLLTRVQRYNIKNFKNISLNVMLM